MSSSVLSFIVHNSAEEKCSFPFAVCLTLFAFQRYRTAVFISIFYCLNEIAVRIVQGNRSSGADIFQHLLFLIRQSLKLGLVFLTLGFRLQRTAVGIGILGKLVLNFRNRLADKQLFKNIGFTGPGPAVKLIAVAAFPLCFPGFKFS